MTSVTSNTLFYQGHGVILARNETPSAISVEQLFGMHCHGGGATMGAGPARTRGMILLETVMGRLEADDWRLVRSDLARDGFTLEWEAQSMPISFTSRWACDVATDVWRRTDAILNSGDTPIVITRCLSRFTFSPGLYEVYTQYSSWCRENQGIWRELYPGGLRLTCEGGRTCQGGTPYLCMREKEQRIGMALHIVPCGNWTIRASTPTALGTSLPFAVVECGMADDDLRFALQPGAVLGMPEIILHTLPDGEPHLGAPLLHQYLQKTDLASITPEAPIVFNTWFDMFSYLDVPRLREQARAAEALGCEVFVVDAGWSPGWGEDSAQCGNWHEKQDMAFRGQMASFADEVRSMGLGFGLWIEPERIGPDAPIYQAHPDWFLATNPPFVPGHGQFYYPDLTQDDVYAYMFGELSRLIETYQLAWMKVDFNFNIDRDPYGTALMRYYTAWYRLWDELRSRFPSCFIEGCASGGMRLDLNTLRHADGHFLSDTVNPFHVLRIYQGALLRLPPGRTTQWAVLRSVGSTIPRTGGKPPEQLPDTIVTPSGAGWTSALAAEIDFAALVALPGMFGFSGDIAGLPHDARQRLRQYTDFYKQWRSYISGSIAHLLTPPCLVHDATGWAAIQLQHPERREALLLVYRLEDSLDQRRFRLRSLEPGTAYRITDLDGNSFGIITGIELVERGLEILLPSLNSAILLILEPVIER